MNGEAAPGPEWNGMGSVFGAGWFHRERTKLMKGMAKLVVLRIGQVIPSNQQLFACPVGFTGLGLNWPAGLSSRKTPAHSAGMKTLPVKKRATTKRLAKKTAKLPPFAVRDPLTGLPVMPRRPGKRMVTTEEIRALIENGA